MMGRGVVGEYKMRRTWEVEKAGMEYGQEIGTGETEGETR